MKDNGKMMKEVAKVTKGIKVETHTMVNSLTTKLMEEGFTNGKRERFMMENGRMGRKMVMVYGEESLEIATLESGKTVKQKVMECMFGKMVINMKESGRIA